MKLRALCCPHCGAPVAATNTLCRFCHAPLQIRAQLELEASAGPTLMDFTTGATPRELAHERRVQAQPRVGLVFSLPAGHAVRASSAAPFCDGSVRVQGVVFDADASLDAGLRVIDAGQAHLGYVLEARPATREITVSRFARVSNAFAGLEALLPWTTTNALRTVGEINVIELLAADSLIQVRINGALVARLDDARFGFGRPIYGVSSHGQAVRATIRSFEYGPI